MCNEIKEAQRNEAIARLEFLQSRGLEPTPVREFKANGTLNYSERIRMGNLLAGILYWVNNEEKFTKAVRDFEDEYNAVVYHATHEYTNFGELLDLFYVSSEQEEWEQLDREDLKDGRALCYTVNFDAPYCSEFGCIAFTVSGGGLVRVG